AVRGGGIDGAGNLTIGATTACQISGNTATSTGGGVAVNASLCTLTMTGGSISGNSANGDGGGVYKYNFGSRVLTLTTVTVQSNTADKDANNSGFGGGIYVDRGT